MSMNQGAIDRIVEEMRVDRAEKEKSAIVEALEKCRVTVEKKIPEREFLFELFGIKCFPKGEIVAITGRAKSGKTFVSSMLISLCVKKDVLEFKRLRDEVLRAVWYDTEQSEESTQEILRDRIYRMCQGAVPEHCIDVFNVRSRDMTVRKELLAQAIINYRPDLVIVDGIRDLVDDINNGVMASEVMGGLMKMASECNCCIVCILHQNKAKDDQNLRGCIGTELTNKAFEVYECQKNENGVFTLKQSMTRKYDIYNEMKYSVNRLGLPYSASQMYETEKSQRESGKAVGKMEGRSALREALRDGKELRGFELKNEYLRLTGDDELGYMNARNSAMAEGVIEKRKVGPKEVYYRLGQTQETIVGKPSGKSPQDSLFR